MGEHCGRDRHAVRLSRGRERLSGGRMIGRMKAAGCKVAKDKHTTTHNPHNDTTPHNHTQPTQPTQRHNTTCTRTKNNTPHTAHITYAQPSQHTHTHKTHHTTPHQHNTAQPTVILRRKSECLDMCTATMNLHSIKICNICNIDDLEEREKRQKKTKKPSPLP